jgi:ABC-type uncharacterized transport system substrate-binding protein
LGWGRCITGIAAGYAKRLKAFQAGLRDLGYVEGKNVVIQSRWAEGNYHQLDALARELVGLKVDEVAGGWALCGLETA